MKNNKRTLAILTAGLLAVTPMAASGLTAFADSTSNYTITVNNNVSGYTYNAYQIFAGDVSGSDPTAYVLSNLDWGNGIANPAAFVSALANSSVLVSGSPATHDFTAAMTVKEVVDVLKGYNETNDVDKLAEFAKIAYANKGTVKGTQATITGSAYPISVTGSGYYLVEETSSTAGAPISRYILDVVGDQTITPKRAIPTLDKKIIESNSNAAQDANTASIGDIVTYTINLKVPDTTGYNKYFYVVNDTLSKGLTYVETTSVVVGGHTLIADTDGNKQTSTSGEYFAEVGTYSGTAGTSIKYIFEDFLNYIKGTDGVAAGDDIVITYKARLNENAVIGNPGNPNTATLTYSNNPNHTYTGVPDGTDTGDNPDAPDEPDTSEPKGTTPEDTVVTYTTEIVIDKVKLGAAETKLQGAKFQLTGESLEAVLHESGIYKKDDSANPAYYLLKDGTYTTTAPTTETAASYVGGATAVKYALVKSTDAGYGEIKKLTAFGTTAADGSLKFSGLGAGTYTIKELVAPDGYNLLANPITVTIGTADGSPSTNGCTWTYSKDGAAAGSSNVIQIENAQGATLPSTGGMGTRMFYIIGGLLVAGSLVLLVTKKRMSSKEN